MRKLFHPVKVTAVLVFALLGTAVNAQKHRHYSYDDTVTVGELIGHSAAEDICSQRFLRQVISDHWCGFCGDEERRKLEQFCRLSCSLVHGRDEWVDLAKDELGVRGAKAKKAVCIAVAWAVVRPNGEWVCDGPHDQLKGAVLASYDACVADIEED